MFGNSPFAAIFAALDRPNKPKKDDKKKPEKVAAAVFEATSDEDEDLDHYEGDLEGFDIEDFRESEAVNRVLNQAM